MADLIKQIKIGSTTYDVGVNLANTEGILPVANGGTGKNNAKDACNIFLNALGTGDSTPIDEDYYISQYVGGGTTTTTYHRRPVSKLYNYVKGKLDSVYLPFTGGTLTGRLIINYSNDAAAATSSSGSLIIGSTSGEHISIDTNEIMAKSNGTTASNLNIQIDGGNITLGKGGSTTTVNTAATLKGSVNINNSSNTPTIQFMPTYNSSSVMGVLRYESPYSTTADDGTVTYTNRSRFCLRAYSAGASPFTSRTSYYYSYYLPNTPNSLTANKTYYFAVRANSSCNASTSKRYVMGMDATDGNMNYNSSVYTSGSVLYGACWNDYAEYRDQDYELRPGYITYCDDDGKLKYTTERLQHFEGVVSDTFGFSIGETDNCKTPLAVSGRVLVYCDPEDRFHAGDCVCAGPDGIAYRMTREEIIEFPDRIVGTVSEIPTYETWGTGNVKVDGRIWIKVR